MGHMPSNFEEPDFVGQVWGENCVDLAITRWPRAGGERQRVGEGTARPGPLGRAGSAGPSRSRAAARFSGAGDWLPSSPSSRRNGGLTRLSDAAAEGSICLGQAQEKAVLRPATQPPSKVIGHVRELS